MLYTDDANLVYPRVFSHADDEKYFNFNFFFLSTVRRPEAGTCLTRLTDCFSGQPSRKFCQLFKNFCQPSKVSRLPTCVNPDAATALR